MSSRAADRQEVAARLCRWFEAIHELTRSSVFAVAPEGPHRRAVVLNVLTRNSRLVHDHDIDDQGTLYPPLCLLLVAACERLGLTLDRGHWAAALGNVSRLYEQVATAGVELADRAGIQLGSPAGLLGQQLDEAMLQAGLAGGPSFVDRDGAEIALGLVINWGIRFLLAYAVECRSQPPASGREDLAWISAQVTPLLATAPRAG